MKTVSTQFIENKTVLLRLDLDVPLRLVRQAHSKQAQSKLVVEDDFRLKAAIPTLKLCLEDASKVIIMGYLGRPNGVEVPGLSVAPIYQWLQAQRYGRDLGNGKLKLLENLRFEPGEDACDLNYAKELASFGEIFINEAFAAYHLAASTTVLPTLLPHFAGLRFSEEVKKLMELRNNPKRPLVAIIGGAKVEDKKDFIFEMSKRADTVLVGGKLAADLVGPAHNVLVGKLNQDGTDITENTLDLWEGIIKGAGQIIWNGPVGKVEDDGSRKGTERLTKIILESNAEVIVGGGDTVGFLGSTGMLEKFEDHGFVSTGGGAMLEFLTKGTLPSIEALE